MRKISEIQNNIDEYLNNDNFYGFFNVYDEDYLTEMARVEKIPHTQYEIHIESGEGFIPHMHICKKNGKNVVLRIKLLTNEYFREKDNVKNTLSTSERKALNEYLSKDSIGGNLSNYQFILYMWNKYNPAHAVDVNFKQPDYTTIKEPK